MDSKSPDKANSPLMDKSRQNSLSNVYKQLYGGKTPRDWKQLKKNMTQHANKNVGIGTMTRLQPPMTSGQLSSSHNHTQTGEVFNIDLVRDGAEMGSNQQLKGKERLIKDMRLPPLKGSHHIEFDDNNQYGDPDSPMLDDDHIFPMLSPTQNHV